MCFHEERREQLDGARLLSEPMGVGTKAQCEHRAEAEAVWAASMCISSPNSTIFLSETKDRAVWLCVGAWEGLD